MRTCLAAYGLVAVALSAASQLAACGDEKSPASEADASMVTYHRDVRALIETRCVGCHRESGIAPFPLERWQDVKAHAPAIAAAVSSGAMPPFGYDGTCRELTSDVPQLSDEERALFEAWRTSQFAEGDPATYKEPEKQATIELGEPDVLLKLKEGYTPDAALADDYRCLPLVHEISNDMFVIGTGIRPDQAALVHHVIVYAVPASERAALKALDDKDEGPGFSCFGDAGVEGAQMVAGWAPGGEEGGYAPDIALRVTAGSQLVMQIHYNTGAAHSERMKAGDSAVTLAADRTELALWTLPAGKSPKRLLSYVAVADLGIQIRAGDRVSKQVSTRRLLLDATIIGVSPHMHLLGTSIHTEIERKDGTRDCLTEVPHWDFHWQRAYLFAPGSEVKVGVDDLVHLTCVYDNSEGHQPAGQGRPRDVTWGEGTRDEMCLDYLLVTVPYRGADQSSGPCNGYRACAKACAPGDSGCHFACMGGLGDSCLGCGIDALTGSCAESHCVGDLSAFGSCYESCETKDTDDFGSCLLVSCKQESDALVECMQPVFDAGPCEAAASCGGL